jgi:hypothetical protein
MNNWRSVVLCLNGQDFLDNWDVYFIVPLICCHGEHPCGLNLITQHMWDMSIFIAIACWVYLTPYYLPGD